MKRFLSAAIALVMTVSFCSCGDTSKVDTLIELPDREAESSVVVSDVEVAAEPETEAATNAAVYNAALANGEYDVDLTILDSTMMYAQVFEMLNNPEDYNGKLIRARGNFSYYKDPKTEKEYFAVLISDITACCAQGIEFRLDGDYSYPEDYPPLDTEITITGICDIYKEGYSTYMQLLHANYKL